MADNIIMRSDQEGNLYDSIKASGVLDISDLDRKGIKELAKKAAGWSGENGTFSWRDVANGQADVQGRFTRHEDLFKRKFNKQLKKNIHHTEQQQLLDAAKEGNAEAMGQYVASKRDDVAPYIIPALAGPAAAILGTTGSAGLMLRGAKNVFNSPIGLLLDGLDVYRGGKELFSENGLKKTWNRAKEGDVWGTVWSGLGDLTNIGGAADFSRRSINFLKDPTIYFPTNYKYITDIGDGGTRWKHINDTNVNQQYDALNADLVDTPYDLAGEMMGHKSVRSVDEDTADMISFLASNLKDDKKDKLQWFADQIQGKSASEMSKILSELPYDKFDEVKSALGDWWFDVENIEGKKAIIEQVRSAQDAMNFADQAMRARNLPFAISNTKTLSINPRYLGGGFNSGDKKTIIMSVIPPNHRIHWNSNRSQLDISPGIKIQDIVSPHSGSVSSSWAAAHETGHNNRFFNWKSDVKSIDSPYYGNDYTTIADRTKQLLTARPTSNLHNVELNEGYSDLLATKFNMHNMGISSAELDPTKKYTYFDLLRYKMTPEGLTDRFIKLRGGWWNGWKQQLNALNEVHKHGGKINE